jgi:small-conductance mechanosensitive channel
MDWLDGIPDWAIGWSILLGSVVLALLIHAVIFGAAGGVARRRPHLLVFEGALLRLSRGPTRLLAPLAGVRLATSFADPYLSTASLALAQVVLDVTLVFATVWLLIRLTGLLEVVTAKKYDLTAEDNLRARQVRTRVSLLRRVLVTLIAFLGLGLLLMQIPGFRTVGTGLLASAGVIGIIVGVAAQRPISNLLAGVQIALTQPIRVDDVVIVEDEWGWIEEITLSYVVVRVWDLRRLVLPISYFLEKPFQNWTRTTSSILGTAFVYADYTVPINEVRTELERIVRASPHWDGQVCVLHVTDLTERTVQLRALVSAPNAGRAFELRAEVREKLIGYLQREHPDALPKIRVTESSLGSERRVVEA